MLCVFKTVWQTEHSRWLKPFVVQVAAKSTTVISVWESLAIDSSLVSPQCVQTALLRPACVETTAWGAASLAGLAVGVFSDTDALKRQWRADRKFLPVMESVERDRLLHGWKRAVERNLRWIESAETL